MSLPYFNQGGKSVKVLRSYNIGKSRDNGKKKGAKGKGKRNLKKAC